MSDTPSLLRDRTKDSQAQKQDIKSLRTVAKQVIVPTIEGLKAMCASRDLLIAQGQSIVHLPIALRSQNQAH